MRPFSTVFQPGAHVLHFFERDQGRSALWDLLLPERIGSVPRVKELPRGFVYDVEWDRWLECAGSKMFDRVTRALGGPGKRLISMVSCRPRDKDGSLTDVQEDLCGKSP